MIDQLQAQIDPNYRKSWAMTERRAAMRGQQVLWRHGELAPSAVPSAEGLFSPPPGQRGFWG